MRHFPIQLHVKFPRHEAPLHALKAGNRHFARLVDRYHELKRSIHREEAETEPTNGDVLEDMEKQRLALMDEIAAMLSR